MSSEKTDVEMWVPNTPEVKWSFVLGVLNTKHDVSRHEAEWAFEVWMQGLKETAYRDGYDQGRVRGYYEELNAGRDT